MEETTGQPESREPFRIRARNLGADLRAALLGRWYWVASALVLALTAAWYYLSVAPPLYQSIATVQVKISTPGVIVSKEDGLQGSDLDLRNLDAINTIVGKFKMLSLYQAMLEENPALMQDPELVPRKLDWTPPWVRAKESSAGTAAPGATIPGSAPTRQSVARESDVAPDTGEPGVTDPAVLARQQAATRELSERASQLAPQIFTCFAVANRRQTRLVDITVSHTSPRMAQLLADAVITAYEKVYVDRRTDRTRSTLVTLKDLSEQARRELQKAQNALAAYRTALSLDAKLQEQEAALSTLLLRYKDKHPDVIESKKQLRETQESFLTEFTAARESSADKEYWDSAEKDRKNPKTGLSANSGDTDSDFESISGPDGLSDDERQKKEPREREEAVREAVRLLQARSKVLESEIESQNRVFDTLLTQMQGANLAPGKDEKQEAEVIPLEAARDGSLTGPRPMPIYAAAGVGGLALGIGLALLLQRLDNRIHTVADLEQLTDAPVLASVAALRPEVLKRSAASVDTDHLLDKWSPDIFFRDNGAKTIEAEMIRILRTSLILLGPKEAFQSILFTSALPGEGKSFTSANVAVAFAMQGARTLLVDMDLRLPRLHTLFGTDRHKGAGLVDVLAGQCALPDSIHPTGLPNLFLLPAGSPAPNPAEILNVDRLKQLLTALKSGFERIVIDTAPLLPVSDTRLISRAVDVCILVAGAEKTPKGAVRRALELLGTAMGGEKGARLGGCVLNGTVETRRNLGYNYSYGYYGKYGRKYTTYGSVYGDDDEEKKVKAKKLKS